MNFNQFQHVIALAELLHFGAAARRLGIAQPQLSQSIKRIEEELGTPLFERSRNHVALTGPGRVFLDEARLAVRHAESAMRMARAAGNPQVRNLRIGCMTVGLYAILPHALERFHARWPEVKVSIEELVTPVQLARLQERTLDLGLVGLNNFAPPHEAVARPLIQSPYVAALPAHWPEAREEHLTLARFAERPFILFPPQQAPAMHAALIEACRSAGYVPRIVEEVARTPSTLALVARGVGMSFVAAAACHNVPEGVVLRPVADLPAILGTEVHLLWIPPVLSDAHRGLINEILVAAAALSSASEPRAA